VLVAKNGQVVQTASSDFYVAPDGTLKMRAAPGSNRRLASDPSTLATAQAVKVSPPTHTHTRARAHTHTHIHTHTYTTDSKPFFDIA
jgi:hypothetical protein